MIIFIKWKYAIAIVLAIAFITELKPDADQLRLLTANVHAVATTTRLVLIPIRWISARSTGIGRIHRQRLP
jgi:hypothetical protein